MASRICDLFGIEFLIFAFSHCRGFAAPAERTFELLDATLAEA